MTREKYERLKTARKSVLIGGPLIYLLLVDYMIARNVVVREARTV